MNTRATVNGPAGAPTSSVPTHGDAESRTRSGDAALRLPLLGAILLAFALGTLRLAAQSLWYDEGVTAMVAQKPVADLVAWTAADIQPPLAYLLVKAGGALWGWSEWALRFPSVLAVTVAVALMARLAADLRPLASHAHKQADPRDWTPLWAAGLLAMHPLVLYYAQEARMYALLLALTIGAAAVLAPALQRPMGRRRWLTYALLATLALYTHYFAAFVLLAFALSWLWPVAGSQRQWRPFLLAHGAMALLYAPWAVIMVRRLGDDASYWQGRLKLGEAIAETAGRFVAGETMPERTAMLLALVVLATTAAGLVLLWRRIPQRRVALHLGLLWLLVPVVGVLLLASFAPKFNVRYVFAALPGLVLIWSMLGAHLVAPAVWAEPSQRRMQVIGLMFIAGLLGIFIWSTVNWHTQPRFAKAQWRQLTEFLRPRLAPEESVFLVSGHAWPVWDYYAPDIPATRLPEIDELDVNRVLDFAATGAPLRATIADAGGAWLVAWQDEVVDPNEVVPVQLELGGREKGSSAQFNQLSLRRWSRIRPARIVDVPPVTVPVDATFGDALNLRGYHTLDNGDLLLFWQATPALEGRDLQVAISVGTPSGEPGSEIAGRRPAGYNDPTFRWRPGDVVMGRFAAADWLGAAPTAGPHTITLRVYDAADPSAAPLAVNGGETLELTNVTPVLE